MTKGKDEYGGASIPDLHCGIIAGRGDALAIQRPCHRRYQTRMPGVGLDEDSTASIPDLHRLVFAPRSDVCAIRRPRHRMHRLRVTAIGEKVCLRGSIPHLHDMLAFEKTIAAGRGDELMDTHRRPRYGVDIRGMATIDKQVSAAVSVPDLHHLIP